MKKLYFAILISTTLLLQACGAGRTIVLEPAAEKRHMRSVHIVSDNPTTQVPEQYQRKFETALANTLYSKSGFSRGGEMTIRYRFLQCEEGNQFARWLTGGLGNTGEGSLLVEARILDNKGKTLSKIQTEGKIGSGLCGGSFDHAILQASSRLAEYVINNYK